MSSLKNIELKTFLLVKKEAYTEAIISVKTFRIDKLFLVNPYNVLYYHFNTSLFLNPTFIYMNLVNLKSSSVGFCSIGFCPGL